MKKRNTFYYVYVAAMLAVIVLIATSCAKTSSSETPLGQQSLSLYLTDAPAVFDKVLVDIKSIQVLVDTSRNTRVSDTCSFERIGRDHHDRRPKAKNDSLLVWEDLGISAGIYDVLQLRNGVDTLLATKSVPKGAVRMIKIELGTNNSVVVDSVTYPVLLPADFPGYVILKFQGHEMDEYLPRKSRIWLDFDIAHSIIKEGNGSYYLRPFFKPFTVKTTGSIYGRVVPLEANPVVMVYNGTDTASAYPNRDGKFKIRGLKEGTYTVQIKASNGYISKTISNVAVTVTKEVELGLITLIK